MTLGLQLPLPYVVALNPPEAPQTLLVGLHGYGDTPENFSTFLGTLAQRLPGLPGVPTFAEQGFPAVQTVFFWAMLSPAGTPPDVVAKLNSALGQTLRDPVVKGEFAKQSMETSPGTSEEIARFMAQETPRWRQIVQKAGLKPE